MKTSTILRSIIVGCMFVPAIEAASHRSASELTKFVAGRMAEREIARRMVCAGSANGLTALFSRTGVRLAIQNMQELEEKDIFGCFTSTTKSDNDKDPLRSRSRLERAVYYLEEEGFTVPTPWTPYKLIHPAVGNDTIIKLEHPVFDIDADQNVGRVFTKERFQDAMLRAGIKNLHVPHKEFFLLPGGYGDKPSTGVLVHYVPPTNPVDAAEVAAEIRKNALPSMTSWEGFKDRNPYAHIALGRGKEDGKLYVTDTVPRSSYYRNETIQYLVIKAARN